MSSTTNGVSFNYQAWIGRYPEFANISEPMAVGFFNEAQLYYNNQGWPGSLPNALTLLNMLTAHIAWLYAPRDDSNNPASTGQNASPLVGRISNASEGSVSVQTELTSSDSPSRDFFAQTKYGLSYWQATLNFRVAHYRARPTRVINGPFPWWGTNNGFPPR